MEFLQRIRFAFMRIFMFYKKYIYIALAVILLVAAGVYQATRPIPQEQQVAVAQQKLKSGDIETALFLLSEAAGRDEEPALMTLASLYMEGTKIPQDIVKSAGFYLRAAELGNLVARKRMVSLYSEGFGVEQSEEKAFDWCRKLALENDSIMDLVNLAHRYFDGIGTEKDEKKAFTYYKLAAEKRNPEAQFIVGTFYEDGRFVLQSHRRARIYYETAANGGYKNAYFALGYLLLNGGPDLPPNKGAAKKWLEKAADAGSENAKRILMQNF